MATKAKPRAMVVVKGCCRTWTARVQGSPPAWAKTGAAASRQSATVRARTWTWGVREHCDEFLPRRKVHVRHLLRSPAQRSHRRRVTLAGAAVPGQLRAGGKPPARVPALLYSY